MSIFDGDALPLRWGLKSFKGWSWGGHEKRSPERC
jgi:hypothetical protein